MRRKICVGDLHFPYHDKSAVTQLLSAIKEEAAKPKKSGLDIIQIGDLYDCFSMSSFPKTHLMTPKDEMVEARLCAEEFWKIARKYAPKARCYQLLGNHDIRPKKILEQKAPELEPFFNYKELFRFPGVKTIFDPREELIIDDIMFIHGHYTRLGQHIQYIQGKHDVVHGHTHRAGIFYMNTNEGKVRFELDVGFLADIYSKVLAYTRQRWTHWTPGYGYINEYRIPSFVPLKNIPH